MIKTVEMDFEFMNYIPAPPVSGEQMMAMATSNDGITIKSWRDIWIKNVKANHASHGPFAENHIGILNGSNAQKPAIVVGSGPSLAENVEVLAQAKDMMIISCLHNFHYMVDHNVDVNYYVSLDAGEVTIEEISEGGKEDAEFYLEKTKDCTLLCFIGSSPNLLKSWRGKVLFFNAPIPDLGIIEEMEKVEKFQMFIGNGGNVLGACTYIAKGILGSNPVVFTGADFCHSYTGKFHAWPSKYDANPGHTVRTVDVFGNKRKTWNSYYNFKSWFDNTCNTVPGIWINCTEGGCLGAYNEGNIMAIRQMTLAEFLKMYTMHEQVKYMCENVGNAVNPEIGQIQLLF